MAETKQKSYDFDFRWKTEAGEVIADDTAIKAETDALWNNIPEASRALVLAGDLTAMVGNVTASAKIEENGKKVEKTAITSYVRLEANTPAAALALMGGRMKAEKDGDGKSQPGVLTRFNYGFDLATRTDIRNPLLSKLEGPEKATERAVKSLVAMGWNEAKARKFLADNPPDSE
jgi:hypothetical protein